MSIDTIRTAIDAANITATTYTVREHAVKEGTYVVSNAAIDGDDDASTQQDCDRALRRALESAGVTMADAGANGGPEGGFWSTWCANG